MTFGQMGLNEWLLIIGTILGPVVAVQAQKWIERARESDGRKKWVFYTLMASRGARLADDHVRALNSIDLVFYGSRALGKAWRSRNAQAVIDAWREYHTHLNLPDDKRPKSQDEFTSWIAKGDELFWNLLAALAEATHHKFQRQELRFGSYSPMAHSTKEHQQDAVRELTLEVLAGKRSLPLDVRSVASNQEFLAADAKFKGEVSAALQEIAKSLATPKA